MKSKGTVHITMTAIGMSDIGWPYQAAVSDWDAAPKGVYPEICRSVNFFSGFS